MLDRVDMLTGREAVLAETGGHAYARLTTGGVGAVTGYRRDGTIAWTAEGPWGPVACALGEADVAARLLADLADAGALGGAEWLHLPRVSGPRLAPYFRVDRHDEWQFRWSATPPPAQAGEDRVVHLDADDADAINRLLDDAFPDTTARPGDPRVLGWYGIWDAGALVACGAHRSRGGIGFLAGIAVATARQGRGLGAALTAGLTRRLFAEYEQVSLGVFSDHHRTIRLYERLGFTGVLDRTSVRLAADGDRPAHRAGARAGRVT